MHLLTPSPAKRGRAGVGAKPRYDLNSYFTISNNSTSNINVDPGLIGGCP